jgi:caffeoyl-CoA O-methyltransferase
MLAAPRPVTPLGILVAKLDGVCAQLEVQGGVDPALIVELDTVRALAAGMDPYLSRCTTPESPALAALARRTSDHDWSQRDGDGVVAALEQEMLSGHVEGQLLKFLVHLTKARQVLELGMFTGYSALAIAEALPPGGRVVACEIDGDVAAFARRCLNVSPCADRIDIRVAPAQTTLDELTAAGEQFDLVFVDADKTSYFAYVQSALDGSLLAADGVIAVDNTLLQGQPYLPGEPTPNGAAIAHFNRMIADDPRVEQVLLPIRDGLTLIRWA